MKKIIFPIAIIATLALSAFTAYDAINWKISPGYSIKFTSKNPSGIFSSFKGDIIFDESNLDASKFDVTIDAASISTGNGMKNSHAKSDKWFNVAKYPTIKFTSSKINKTTSGYEAVSILDLHGIQKQIVIPFAFANNTFTGSFEINRLDYKVGTNEGMNANASTTLKVDVSVPVTK